MILQKVFNLSIFIPAEVILLLVILFTNVIVIVTVANVLQAMMQAAY